MLRGFLEGLAVISRLFLYLHPLDGVRAGVGLMQEECVLHVLRQALQEAERLIEDHRHRDLGELLKRHTT